MRTGASSSSLPKFSNWERITSTLSACISCQLCILNIRVSVTTRTRGSFQMGGASSIIFLEGLGGGRRLSKKTSHVFSGGRICSDRVDSTRPDHTLRLGDVTGRGIGREANIWIMARSQEKCMTDG